MATDPSPVCELFSETDPEVALELLRRARERAVAWRAPTVSAWRV